MNAIAFHNISLESDQKSLREFKTNMTKNVIALTTDPDRRRVYYSDIHRRAISWVSYDAQSSGNLITSKEDIYSKSKSIVSIVGYETDI